MKTPSTKISFFKIFKHYWKYIKVFPLLLFLLLITPILGEIFDILPQYGLRDVINILAKTPLEESSQVFPLLLTLFAFITGYKIAQFFSFRVLGYALIEMETRVMKKLAEDAFRYLHGHSIEFFQNRFVGSLVKQVNRYVDSFENILDQLTWSFLPLITQFVISQIVLTSIHWTFGLAMLLWTFIFMGGSIWFSQRKSKYDMEESAASSKLSGHLSDSISNMLSVKVCAGFEHEQGIFKKSTETLYQKQRKKWYFGMWGDAFQGFTMIIMESLLLYLALLLWREGVVTPGDIVLLIGASLTLFRRLWGLGRSINKLYSALTYTQEMLDILEAPHSILDPEDERALILSRGEVTFEKVSFHYGSKVLLQNFSLILHPGERVALVGRSGAGKSTLIKLLLRFHDPLSGSINIDGQSLCRVTQDSLHRSIAYVPQEPSLFHRTIRENIAYSRPEATHDEIITAAKLAHAHEFISSFPEGYDTYVGERGVRLSGGERQRIAIARAILSQAPIIILDEATSSLDSESERLIQEALHRLMEGKTTLVVAHRLSTIMEMDRILVLDKGKITEEGSHEELLAKKGHYHKLWSIQSGGFLGE